jgi:hypothetical protein
MASRATRKIWRRLRLGFRYFRVTIWLIVLFVVASLVYLNKVGLPDFVKNPILAELRARGLELDFSRLRLLWYRGIVAENINMGSREAGGPQFFIDEAEVCLRYSALAHFRIELESLVIRQARFCWTLPAVEEYPARPLSVDNISTELQFLPQDVWVLSNLRGHFLGADLVFAGAVTNASFLKELKGPVDTNKVAAAQGNLWHRLLYLRDSIDFQSTPRIEAHLQIDARHPERFTGDASIKLAGARFPGGSVGDVQLNVNGGAADDGVGPAIAELRTKVAGLQIEKFRVATAQFNSRVELNSTNSMPEHVTVQAKLRQGKLPWGTFATASILGETRPDKEVKGWKTQWHGEVDRPETPWGSAASLETKGECMMPALSLTNVDSTVGGPSGLGKWLREYWAGVENQANTNAYAAVETTLKKVKTQWAEANAVRLSVHAHRNAQPGDRELSGLEKGQWWDDLRPFDGQADGTIEGVSNVYGQVDRFEFSSQWRPPNLNLSGLHAQLFGGHFNARAGVNLDTRKADAEIESSFDVHQVGILVGPGSQRWLRQFGWGTPPQVRAQVGVTLPVWSLPLEQWPDAMDPTLTVAGSVSSWPAMFRGVPASSAELHFNYENGMWFIPDISVRRPEGEVYLTYVEDPESHGFFWEGRSSIDLTALKPLFTESQFKAMNLFQFTSPPVIAGNVWGVWHGENSLGLRAVVDANDFNFRGESITKAHLPLAFTNEWLSSTGAVILHEDEQVEVPQAWFNTREMRLYLTNALARIEPGVVARAIGPMTAEILEPYHFGKPPKVLVNGWLDVTDTDQADMMFQVEGGPFRYWRFNVDSVSADVHWKGPSLNISNFQGQFYRGQIQGVLDADFTARTGTDMSYRIAITNTDMRTLMQDISKATNRLEGTLAGELNITHLNSADWKSWQGDGRMHLKQGLIWDIPMFGMFSTVLNSIVPGVGNSRAEEGNATFIITNSIISTKDLDIRASAMRLYYLGTVDFDANVNARMEASLFRDWWLPGKVFGLALTPLTKLLEYKVTGTLSNPKSQPLYILHKFLLAPLHPIKAIKDLFPTEEGRSNTGEKDPARDKK